MKPQPTPQNDLNIGLATIKSTTRGWIAPGGATTRSERTARGWYTRLLALRDTPEAEEERMQDGHQL